MNNRPFTLSLLVIFLAVSFPGPCAGKDQKTPLTVKKIAFTRDMAGRERITLSCNQSCAPELFSLEEENLRVVMDMKGVSRIQTKVRNINTGGKLVKGVRNYLDKQTKILRVVLDMEPSKYYIVRPMQAPSGNTYVLTINEDTSTAERKPGGSKDTGGSLLSQEKHIAILRPDQRPTEQGSKLQEAAPGQVKQEDKLKEALPVPEKSKTVEASRDVLSVDQGRSQLNASEFDAAVKTFTQILAAHPKDSLSYRLRGNAYDNLNNRQKALEDWTQAARLGDTTIQSYLDFLQVKWQESPAP